MKFFLLFISFINLCLSTNAQSQFWGVTQGGGQNNNGVIFRTDNTGNNQVVELSSNDGNLNGTLLYASDGKLYGMTQNGGLNGYGVLFQYDPATHIYSKKIDFDDATSGSGAYGSLMQASDGMIYGLTSGGGLYLGGVLFQFNPLTDVYTKKIDFDGTTNGSNPYGKLIQATDGMLYGVTRQGAGFGTLFQYDIATSTLTNKINFNGSGNGAFPSGPLMQATDGMLYGMTRQGGATGPGYGVLFQYNPITSVLTKKIDLSVSIGRYPSGGLTQAADGNLYGLTEEGGANSAGVIFQFNPVTDVYTKKIDFDGFSIGNGGYPKGDLLLASNGKFYGMSSIGGVNGYGTVFEYNSTNDAFVKTIDFNITNGMAPQYSSLIEMPLSIVTQSINNNYCMGDSVFVPFTISGSYDAGNVFTAQLSDASGSFSSPLSIGSCSTTSPSTIHALVSSLSPGTGYRIRVTSSNPSIIGANNGSNISINALPILVPTTSSSLLCSGQSATLSASGASTYSWSTSQIGPNIVISPTTSLSYTVTGIDVNGCANNASITQSVSSCVGINNLTTTDFFVNVFPNPAKETLNIDFGSIGNSDRIIKIVNVVGEVLILQTETSQYSKINMKELSSGIYYLNIRYQNQQKSIKLIKE